MSVPTVPMRVEFRRSGGMAGIDMTASVDTAELPVEQAEVAAALMSPGSVPPSPAAAAGAPDRFSYELTVRDGEHTQTHHWTETPVPEVVQPLLTGLGHRARPAPPS